jgi:hypothetical protein
MLEDMNAANDVAEKLKQKQLSPVNMIWYWTLRISGSPSMNQ